MALITNRSGGTWDFGPLRVPPGDSHHSLAAIKQAVSTTCFAKHMVMAGDLRAPHAKFVLLVAGVHTWAELTDAEETAPPAETEPVAEDPELPDEPPSPGRKLGAHSRSELREMASELGIDGARHMLKSDLLRALREL